MHWVDSMKNPKFHKGFFWGIWLSLWMCVHNGCMKGQATITCNYTHHVHTCNYFHCILASSFIIGSSGCMEPHESTVVLPFVLRINPSSFHVYKCCQDASITKQHPWNKIIRKSNEVPWKKQELLVWLYRTTSCAQHVNKYPGRKSHDSPRWFELNAAKKKHEISQRPAGENAWYTSASTKHRTTDGKREFSWIDFRPRHHFVAVGCI
jgi:hypothetical protein